MAAGTAVAAGVGYAVCRPAASRAIASTRRCMHIQLLLLCACYSDSTKGKCAALTQAALDICEHHGNHSAVCGTLTARQHSVCSSWSPTSTTGKIYSSEFLTAVRPLHSEVMGVENMAPLLYTMARFVKVVVYPDVE